MTIYKQGGKVSLAQMTLEICCLIAYQALLAKINLMMSISEFTCMILNMREPLMRFHLAEDQGLFFLSYY